MLSDLLSEARARGASVVLASHVLSDLSERCDEVAVLLGEEDDADIVIDKVLTGLHRRDDETRNALIAHALTTVTARWPEHAIRISTSLDQRTFYESFGFRKTVGPFFEHGTPCIGMVRREAGAAPSGQSIPVF